MPQSSASEISRHASTWSILWGVTLILLGMVAIALPLLAAAAVNGLIAWLLMVAGVVHLIIAFHAHRAGSLIWRLLVGLAYLFFGGYLIAHPLLGVASLTLLLAALFLIEGIFDIGLFFRVRAVQGSNWVLIDGLVTLVLGLMIYMQWPGSSAWAIGTLVGASLIISGVTRVMLSFALRKANAVISPPSSLAA
jgi:uncharacterized membrane protein HdeD (DUF308 family)